MRPVALLLAAALAPAPVKAAEPLRVYELVKIHGAGLTGAP
jgi:hypothetical protein